MSPTTKGRFVIFKIGKHLSPTYPFSSGIEWGTPLRIEHNIAQVKRNGVWMRLSSVAGFTQFNSKEGEEAILSFIRDQYESYKSKIDKSILTAKEQSEKYPDNWIFNDFGHVTVKYFVDRNGDYKLNKGEKIMTEYMHTTPYNEFYTAHKVDFNLSISHGCIHIKPDDIDTFIANGYIKTGSVIEVKSYTETYIPLSFEAGYGKPDYELHFYPGEQKIIIYAVSQL